MRTGLFIRMGVRIGGGGGWTIVVASSYFLLDKCQSFYTLRIIYVYRLHPYEGF